MLTQLRGDRLSGWLNRVYVGEPPSLHAFANGIDRDRPAVTAGLTLPYSSGKVEGNVNRVKLLMRQMFDRARFPYSANASPPPVGPSRRRRTAAGGGLARRRADRRTLALQLGVVPGDRRRLPGGDRL
jgi:hypothetical protein